jgi:predicted DNA-binding transcriptional regulator AlpA
MAGKSAVSERLNNGCLMTSRQLAEFLGVSVAALVSWRELGTGPRWMRVGARNVRYRPQDVKQWLEAGAKAK